MTKYTGAKDVYPYTGVLVNKLGITQADDLDFMEKEIVAPKLLKLQLYPVRGSLDDKHLKKIHRYLFEDLYGFAGTYRTVDIAKGNTRFANAYFISDNVKELTKSIKQMKATDRDIFSKEIADFFAYLNHIHPFREGNGRTSREFTRQIGLNFGYELDWTKIDRDAYMNASIKSIHDETAMEPIF